MLKRQIHGLRPRLTGSESLGKGSLGTNFPRESRALESLQIGLLQTSSR